MQEVSSRVIEDGDLVAYDTDLVGAYGMMCDVSRTWLAGDGLPSTDQQRVFDLAEEQIERPRWRSNRVSSDGGEDNELWR